MSEKLVLGRFEESRNGVPLKYRIETISPELTDQVIDHMIKHYLSRERLATYVDILNDEPSLNSFTTLWRDIIKTGTAMVALEERDDGEIKILGANSTCIKEKDRKKYQEFEGEAFNQKSKFFKNVAEKYNIYERYGVDKYLSGYGLFVHPDYHGYKIGYRMLTCREPLCKALGLEATAGMFTVKAGQHIARKAGFEMLAEERYDTFALIGEVAYPGLDGSLTYMGRKFNFS